MLKKFLLIFLFLILLGSTSCKFSWQKTFNDFRNSTWVQTSESDLNIFISIDDDGDATAVVKWGINELSCIASYGFESISFVDKILSSRNDGPNNIYFGCFYYYIKGNIATLNFRTNDFYLLEGFNPESDFSITLKKQ